MITLFGDLNSGNVHKVQLILRHIGVPYLRVDTAQTRGEPQSQAFREINSIGKVPALVFVNGDVLSESNAILFYLSENTDLWPTSRRAQAEVLRWMFFEQYNHEPAIAVIRYLKHYAADERRSKEIPSLQERAHRALKVLENRLVSSDWLAHSTCTIADYALYPYTRVMDEAGIDSNLYPAVCEWLQRFECQPDFIAMGTDGATETVTFAAYIASRAGPTRF